MPTARAKPQAGHRESGLTRRAILASGMGAAALVALPDVTASAAPAAGTARVAGPGTAGHFFLYGVTPLTGLTSNVHSATAPSAGSLALPAPASVTTDLAASPVLSPDQSLLALAKVTSAAASATVTLTIIAKATGTAQQAASLTIDGVPADAAITVTPAFTPDSSVVAVVLAIMTRVNPRLVRKADPQAGGTRQVQVTDLQAQHALAYLDTKSGSLAGPFFLGDTGKLAITTVAATGSDLLVWTVTDPRTLHLAKGYKQAPVLASISAYPLGEPAARFTVPAAGPWPSGEPVTALSTGDVARVVRGRTIQVVSASNGDQGEVALAALSATRAKPTPATITARPDGTVFLAKAGVGRAVIADPAQSFRVRSDISFPAPAIGGGGPASKAVLSPDGGTVYVLGGASAGGLSAYDAGTGALAASFSDGGHYSGVYQLPSGTLVAIGADSTQVSYFSPALDPLGSVDAGLSVAAVY